MLQNLNDNEPHHWGSFFIRTKDDMAAMFRRIQKRYDLLNHIFSLGRDIAWRRQSAKLLQFERADRILDFGAGTGDFTMALRRSVDVNIVALDLVPDMFDRFRAKLSGEDATRLAMVIGDGERLPFADSAFEGVVAGFVGRNLFDLKGGLREILRVLTPGGKLGFLEFSRPGNPVVKAVTWAYFRFIVARLGNLFLPREMPAYSYLIHSVGAFHTVAELSHILRKVGFKNICSYPFNLGTVVLTTGEK